MSVFEMIKISVQVDGEEVSCPYITGSTYRDLVKEYGEEAKSETIRIVQAEIGLALDKVLSK